MTISTEIHWQSLIDGAVKTLLRHRNDLALLPVDNEAKVAIVKQILKELGE